MAVLTLSRITSPSCPVMVKRPDPLLRVASTKRSWPPVGVTPKPIETPTVKRSARSGSKISAPTMCGRCCASTAMRPSAFGPHSASAASASSPPRASGCGVAASPVPASRSAAQRQTCAIRRSSERTPLSMVHLVMRSVTAALLNIKRGSSGSCNAFGFGPLASACVSLSGPVASSAAAESSAASVPAAAGASGWGSSSRSSACSRRCLGNRCVSAMCTFSSTV
mmetsp:Transcript_92935/g.258844  ORF Transcript_92935/g.258844 Transcript_92935/m.258844 type:complete len:224 (-) Transcript_92935:1646-2317(-)